MKHSFYILISILLWSAQLVVACVSDVNFSIEEKIFFSEKLIEGTVVAQESFWLKEENRIVTVHTVEIEKNFTNKQAGKIKVLTNGGIVEDEWHHSSAELSLQTGDKGVFFLATETAYISKKNETHNACYAHFGKTSFIRISKADKIDENSQLTKLYSKLPSPEYNKNTKSNNGENAKSASPNMAISCVFPETMTGGNRDTLLIEGYGFGEFVSGLSKVRMRNPNNGGYDYIDVPEVSIYTWSNDSITLIVPQSVGSGDIQVVHADGSSATSDFEVTVLYALKSARKDEMPTHLINKNGSGGYTFTFGESLMNNAEANQAFMRALNTIRNEIGFNVIISDTSTTIQDSGNDGTDVIAFSETALPSNALAVAYNQFRRCGNGWEVAGMDIFFRPLNENSTWYFGEAEAGPGQSDFESVALHEIMHTFQVNHNNHESSLMYYVYTRGTNRRALTELYELTAASAVNERSLNYTPTCSGHAPYQVYEGFVEVDLSNVEIPEPKYCCTQPSLIVKVLLEGFYQGNGRMNADYAINGLLPIEQPFNQEPWFYNGAESLVNFDIQTEEIVDWVLIEFNEEDNPDQVVFTQAGVLRNDGVIVYDELKDDYVSQGFDLSKKYFINIVQSNHLIIKSAFPVDLSIGDLYDFTTDRSQTQFEAIGETEDGFYVMYSGDFDGNGVINNQDYNKWAQNAAGVAVYSPIDADGNGIVNNKDYNVWAQNRSKISPAAYLE